MKIEIFTPPDFDKAPLDLSKLHDLTGKEYHYVSKGRYAIYHILKALNASGKIMIPVYACNSIKYAVQKAGMECVYYDIDAEDLNACLQSVKDTFLRTKAKYLLVASLYGNPANLPALNGFCAENGIRLIDDAAQSFGAKIENKYVGTFGDAGFFSFSPGKATAGHMGSFFWTAVPSYKIERTRHRLYHYISYADYFYNRLKIYRYRSGAYRYISKIHRILDKFVDITNDSMCSFENNILGGILEDHLDDKFSFRQYYFNMFTRKFSDVDAFRIIKAVRGMPCNHKIVIIMNSAAHADDMCRFMREKGIFTYRGYPILDKDVCYPAAQSVIGRIVELPIENDDEKMQYMFDCIRGYCK